MSGVTYGGAAVVRFGVLGLTLGHDRGAGFLDSYRFSGVGGGCGLVGTSGALRGELFAVAGWHAYRGVGSRFLEPDPGASATLVYAGGRASALYEAGKGVVRGQFGLTLGLEADLGRRTSTSTYAEYFSTNTTSTQHRVGGTQFLAQLVAGIAIGP